MNGFVIFALVTGSFYVVGGFVYAGRNAMIDLNWAYKLYKSILP